MPLQDITNEVLNIITGIVQDPDDFRLYDSLFTEYLEKVNNGIHGDNEFMGLIGSFAEYSVMHFFLSQFIAVQAATGTDLAHFYEDLKKDIMIRRIFKETTIEFTVEMAYIYGMSNNMLLFDSYVEGFAQFYILNVTMYHYLLGLLKKDVPPGLQRLVDQINRNEFLRGYSYQSILTISKGVV